MSTNTPAARSTHNQLQALMDILESSLAGYWDWHIADNTEYLSPAFKRMFGYADHELPNTSESWQQLIFPEDLSLVQANYQQHVQSRGQIPYHNEVRFRHRDGSTVWVICTGRVIEWAEDGSPLRMVGCHVDITPRKQAEEQLRLGASVFIHAREGILITDAEARIVEVNDTFSEITGYSRAEVLGENPRLLSSGYHDRAFFSALWRDLLNKGHWYGEIWNRRRNGEIYPELLTISTVPGKDGQTQHYVAMFLDISAQKRHQRELERLAHYDPLTTLPNRLLLSDRLTHAMAQSRRRQERLAVVYLDLDGFKAVNDGHGHRAGDQLLTVVAQRLQKTLRDGDTIARVGGDEFIAVLLDLPDSHGIDTILKRLLTSAAQSVPWEGAHLQVSVSIGVSLYPQEADLGSEQLIRQADHAMYQAKVAGKNRFCYFTAEQGPSLQGYRDSTADLQRALRQGELVLYYQPMVNMRSGQLLAAEALLRWQHPQRGLLTPGAFLPTLEHHHGLMVELGTWVLQQALQQRQRWQAEGLELLVSINAHSHQVLGFLDELQALLATHDNDTIPSLQIEMRETHALENLEHISATMRACQKLGVRFALDDFGTGYSSLSYLKQLPADCLKIDHSFVRKMLEDPEDLAILEGVLGLATAFRRSVAAEGVETVAQGEMLLRLGCEIAQGYAIAAPMPAAKLLPWLRRWQPPPRWSRAAQVSRDDLSLLSAGVEHRAWVQSLLRYLQGIQSSPPEPDECHCRFGQWLRQRGHEYAQHPDYPELLKLHRRIHQLATELVAIRQQQGVFRADPPALLAYRDALLQRLESLLSPVGVPLAHDAAPWAYCADDTPEPPANPALRADDAVFAPPPPHRG